MNTKVNPKELDAYKTTKEKLDKERGGEGGPETGPETAPEVETPPVPDLAALEKEIAALKEKLAAAEDRVLRVSADFDNFRKRAAKDRQELQLGARFETIIAFLPVFDHFELALGAVGEATNIDAIVDGMKLIKNEFARALKQLGVETIDAIGECFDPTMHEAIANEPSSEYESGVVSKQWKVGYKMGDRLIRPASVVVSSGGAAAQNNETAEPKT